jgi:hypothetical protein
MLRNTFDTAANNGHCVLDWALLHLRSRRRRPEEPTSHEDGYYPSPWGVPTAGHPRAADRSGSTRHLSAVEENTECLGN